MYDPYTLTSYSFWTIVNVLSSLRAFNLIIIIIIIIIIMIIIIIIVIIIIMNFIKVSFLLAQAQCLTNWGDCSLTSYVALLKNRNERRTCIYLVLSATIRRSATRMYLPRSFSHGSDESSLRTDPTHTRNDF